MQLNPYCHLNTPLYSCIYPSLLFLQTPNVNQYVMFEATSCNMGSYTLNLRASDNLPGVKKGSEF